MVVGAAKTGAPVARMERSEIFFHGFGSFALNAYSASSASRGDISSGCSAFTASSSCSASLGGAASAAARGDGEQRQIVDQRPRGLAAVLRLEFCQYRFGARDHGRRQAGEPRHLDAVGAVGGARQHLVQEHDVALPFLDPHGGVEHPRQLCRQRGQFVIMRGKQRAAAVVLMQMFDRGPGDRQAVERRGAAPDLVEDDERAFAGLVQDCRGLDHLHHEGGTATRQIVRRADAREQAVDDADPRPARRHEAADLRQQRDQRVLAQEGRFCRPCWDR